nr:CD209 antigen-like protein E [Zootoca vivipara]
MEMIRSTVVGTDSKYKDKDDLLILAAAENLTREIQYLTSRNDQLQKEIDIISRNVKDGWVYFNNAYYWLSDEEHSWMNSQQACQREDATLLSIETKEEQIFVADLVYAKKKPFWLGLFKDKQGKWKWLSGTMVGADEYWRRKEPNSGKKHDCGAMYFSCPQTKCWVAYICEHRKGCICKKVPKDVWLN